MACVELQNIDREAELVALARLVIYARETARGLRSGEVEAGLSVTLEAITKELTGDIDMDVAAAGKSGEPTGRRYQ
ncbi:hypothetical protein ACFFP0_06320 [Rhizobium puerariae]|uniref:Uncharacterized protein n=1 Tax=Rhizobium puerariae TaxID=1585791 RepID=A0ABV6AD17_9HYPH